MEPKKLLLARVDALLFQLEQIERALNSESLDAGLRNRVGQEFQNAIGDQRVKLKGDLALISKQELSKTAWTTLCTREQDCATLLRECLAYLQGARAREAESDGWLYAVADFMLDGISDACGLHWGRFTMPGDDEFFSDMVQIIRLRCPLNGIWDLPVAAHEFGHFAAYRLSVAEGDGSRTLAFKDYLNGYLGQHPELGKQWKYYLNEYFADVFATYALGPAYACTSLLLRFDVAGAHAEQDMRHPSYAKRAYLILKILCRMNAERDSKGDYQGAAAVLQGFWSDMLVSAGLGTGLAEGEGQQLDGFGSEFYLLLKRGARNARYNRWSAAKALVPTMRSNKARDLPEYEIRDLLNAAWLARLEPGSSPQAIGDRVMALSRAQMG